MTRMLKHGALSLAALLTTATAEAHGGMWRANRIHVAPDDPMRIVLQSALRGPIFSSDGGETWRWVCAESYGRSSINAAPVTMLMRPHGRLMVASYGRGLLVSEGSPCSFTSPAGFAEKFVRDVTERGDGRLVALGSSDSESAVRDALFASDDDGASFRPLGTALPEDFIATSLSATETRIYVAGQSDRGWTIARSDDEARTWTFGELVPFTSRVGWGASIVAVARGAADLLLVLQDETEWDAAQQSGDHLFASEDGGRTFRTVYTDGRPVYGVARSPDGKTLLVGGERGLFRAAFTDALARGAAAFSQRATTPFYGLTWTTAGLYAGMEEFGATSADAFSLGFSTDGGETFSKRMSLCDTQAYDCAPDSRAGQLCPPVFSDNWEKGGGFKEDFLDSDRCQEPASPLLMSIDPSTSPR